MQSLLLAALRGLQLLPTRTRTSVLLLRFTCFGMLMMICITEGFSSFSSPIILNTRTITAHGTNTRTVPHPFRTMNIINNNNFVLLAAARGNKGDDDDINRNNNEMILAEDEPLSSRFQRAVVLQRSGDHTSALTEYETFIKAAESCDVSPELYAEVHVNMGAIHAKLKDRPKAKKSFQIALRYRELGSARVNLALLALADGQLSLDPRDGVIALKEARMHCLKALEINVNDDSGDGNGDAHSSVNGARRLLKDVENMLQQAGDL